MTPQRSRCAPRTPERLAAEGNGSWSGVFWIEARFQEVADLGQRSNAQSFDFGSEDISVLRRSSNR